MATGGHVETIGGKPTANTSLAGTWRISTRRCSSTASNVVLTARNHTEGPPVRVAAGDSTPAIARQAALPWVDHVRFGPSTLLYVSLYSRIAGILTLSLR